VPSRNQPAARALADVPKVVIDFGAAEESPSPADPKAAPRGIVRSAEITTSGRAAPAVPGAPAEGPSILLDPRLMAEMDALERSNQPPPPAPAPPPAPPRPSAPPGGAAVVSFVHAKPPAAPPSISSTAPTIPVAAPNIPVATRRASSEFDAVEKDFFAREPEPEEGDSSDRSAGQSGVQTEPDLDAGSEPNREP